MEDRYLYKAKRLDNGEWVEGNILLDIEKNKPFETYRIYPINHVDICRMVNETTICQCTGLKDKNGKLIWENDIIVYRDFTEEKYVIAWNQNDACFECQQYGCSIMNFEQLSGCEVEVIGNIFDNLELLEGV